MSDLDDDLLALAGGDSSDEEENSSEEEYEAYEGDGGVGGEYSDEDLEELALGKSRSDDEDDEEDEVFVNPYPLEGKYKDEADKAHLAGLAEIERESILFDRSQEIEKYNQRLYLAQRAKERRLAEKRARESSSKATRVSTRDKSGSSSTKQNKLSELKKRREEKKSKASGRASIPYEDEEEESEQSDYGSQKDYSDEDLKNDKVEWAEPKKAREVTVDDLNKVRFGRTLFAKYCHHPGFENAVIGTYVRINIGYDREKQTPVYRICEVKGLQRSKPYKFQNRTADELIVVASGSSERAFEMGICSDKPFTEEEFRWWKQNLLKDEIVVPTTKRTDRKLKELIEFKAHVLTPEEVNELIQRRQKLSNSTGVGVVLEKAQLQQQRVVALENNELDFVEEIDRKIAAVESKLNATNTHVSPLDKLAQVNVRNRRANQSGVRRAEIKANEERRKTGSTSVTANPFSRLRTTARIFYETEADKAASQARQAEEEALMKQKEKEEKERREKEKALKKKAVAADEVDEMISRIDIVLEVEI
ncbi:hypothetical protein DV454_001091 [Geotrichum candidum]|nr:hypothetical protein DV454_001091 [Geotrichum candidum]